MLAAIFVLLRESTTTVLIEGDHGVVFVDFDPASYCATSQQRAELKQLTLNAEERDRIAKRRAVKEDRLRARHECERARLYEKHSRESERLQKAGAQ